MGMSAMRLPGEIFYRPWLFALSILIAVAAASVAPLFAVSLRTAGQRGIAALVMAAAICGMHFTGMAGTVIVASPVLTGAAQGQLVSGSLLAAANVLCETLARGRSAAFSAYLAKPINVAVLVAAIGAAVASPTVPMSLRTAV